MVTIPFLPKPGLLEYVRTQLLAGEDGALGPFSSVLDLDVSKVAAGAAVDRVVISGLEIQQGSVAVYYRVCCSVMDGRAGVEPASLERTVTGLSGKKGWMFNKAARQRDSISHPAPNSHFTSPRRAA